VTELNIDYENSHGVCTTDFEPLLDCKETAHLLHLHPKTVERLARSGDLPAVKIGKRWLFRASEIDRWMASLVDSSRRSVSRGEENIP
jgi:excisionase family DNA binding protein